MNDTSTERRNQSAWATLRHRKVVQWGLVYIAAAWGFLQGLEYVSESFHWPEQLRQIALLALLIGLPIVLVLAWYHGDRAQRRITTPEFAILTLLLLLGGGVFWYYQRASEAVRDNLPQTADMIKKDSSPSVTDAHPSIAVLPFENRSREADDAFFVDGVHDDILTQLSKVSALRVISRTSVEQFRDTKLPMKTIADQLGVRKILEGGVQRAGDRVRVTVQLIDAASDAHLWAENYDRELSAANIFAIQSEVASDIAAALKTSLTAEEQTRADLIPTRSFDAWKSYQIGKQRMANRNSDALSQAEAQFRRAIAADPKFALAWVGLTDTLDLQVTYAGRPMDAGLGDAEKAVTRALELDSNLAEAWASAGSIALDRLEYDRAEQLLRRALALNPNYAPAHHWLSMSLSGPGGRDAEALAAIERASTLDPLSAIINIWLGKVRADVGHFDDALAAFGQAMEIDPSMAVSYSSVGIVQAYGFGHWSTAMAWFEKAAQLDPGNPDSLAALAYAHWQLNNDGEAGRWLDRALKNGGGLPYPNFVAAILDLYRGDVPSARKHAQRAVVDAPWNLYLIRDDDLRRGDYSTARARYVKTFPELFAKPLPKLTYLATWAGIDLALVLQHTGEGDRARELLDRGEAYFQTIPRMGQWGYRFGDVAIHALRGETSMALSKLREAERAGCRDSWRYYRDFDPNLASIRNEPEFKAIFADIERDMAKQRAELAARPKNAPLELTATGT